jgi:hypothetical protein
LNARCCSSPGSPSSGGHRRKRKEWQSRIFPDTAHASGYRPGVAPQVLLHVVRRYRSKECGSGLTDPSVQAVQACRLHAMQMHASNAPLGGKFAIPIGQRSIAVPAGIYVINLVTRGADVSKWRRKLAYHITYVAGPLAKAVRRQTKQSRDPSHPTNSRFAKILRHHL